ncbi:SRPBCC family protein [Sphingopyxis sp. JAI128]|uniref:SRPBCC family protein n=1 Tax=Sphingopyxis sp. JAI128 TaxID=2723066 RepID=UPI00161FF431|nr:SRPBCC family protein [Sphingopyxis sp. JAI128]MBB6426440.1 hypothetical protein [Sphingopyxis sp. JAI128]
MRFSGYFSAAAMAGALALAPVAQAKVVDQGEAGFTVAHTAQVAAAPADVWKMLRMPQNWWSKDHSWSGDAANFWLDSQAGGCFCEKLPNGESGLGSVQHARIVFAKPNEMLRLSGAFGPLQGEALTGTLTIQIKETPTGSALRFDYVVGGYMRFKVADIAPAVDTVIGEQLAGLANALGGALRPIGNERAADKSAAETPPQKDEEGLDSAVADLVPEESEPRY